MVGAATGDGGFPVDHGFWADAVLIGHASFVLFVVGGQAAILAGWWRGWTWTRNPPFRILHLAAIGFVVGQQWLGGMCPLTVWESSLRRRAGAEGYEAGFIVDWIERLLFYSAPAWAFTLVYTAFAALVALAFWGHRPGWPARREPPA
jgi:hypothetical protein